MSTAQPFERPAASGESTVGLDTEEVAEPIAPDVEDLANRVGQVVRQSARMGDQIGVLAARLSVPLLRAALGLVYLWFGGLKVANRSDIFDLVAATLPFVNPHVFVPLLGVFEIILGIGLITGRLPKLVLLGVLGHLAGTFLSVITAPSFMWHHGNPLLLTMDGEFVLKNLVLISAALVLMGVTSRIRVGTAEMPSARRT
jgi:putative oxidoreductase